MATKTQWQEALASECASRGLDSGAREHLFAYVNKLLDQNLPVIFDLQHLSRLIGIRTRKLAAIVHSTDRFYRLFLIRKSSGSWREIAAPNVVLKECQRWVLRNILEKAALPECIQGFARNRSIATNAGFHINKPIVLNIDIKDFFPSIGWERAFNYFRHLGYSKKVSFYLTKITTLNKVLPQGAPTSPMISNLVVRHLDLRLSQLARGNEYTYSRYADDLTFSGGTSLVSMLPLIKRIVKEEGFDLNESKTRIMRSHRRQEVTGLVVNESVSVSRSHLRWLRQQLYYMKKFGVATCAKRAPQKNKREFFYGHALFVKMINRAKGDSLLTTLDSIEW